MKGTVISVDKSTEYDAELTIECESGETFTTSFDKKIFMARYSGFKHRYGVYPDDSEGVEVSCEPPNSVHSGKIDILSN